MLEYEGVAEYADKIVTYDGDQVKVIAIKGELVTIINPKSGSKRQVHVTNLTSLQAGDKTA